MKNMEAFDSATITLYCAIAQLKCLSMALSEQTSCPPARHVMSDALLGIELALEHAYNQLAEV